jgi:type I restriction enzyme, S subunit
MPTVRKITPPETAPAAAPAPVTLPAESSSRVTARPARNGELPRGWRRVKFGDVVRNVTVTVDPAESGLERYIAGEHMDTDDLHLRRWGTIGEDYLGPAFHRKFVAGQVLYGSRRTYLRKVAVADFDGICANTTFVLEPLDDNLIPELLPFIMQTESFVTHSVQQSRGSTNPYVTFKDLAWYEFALPPRDEQRRIAEILWAADEAVEANQTALQKLSFAAELMFETILRNKKLSVNGHHQEPIDNLWREVPLGSVLLDIQYGTSQRATSEIPGAVPILRIPNVIGGNLDIADLSWVELSAYERERFAVREGDILLVRTNGNPSYVGRSAVVRNAPAQAVFASYLIRLRVDREQVAPDYINALLNSTYLRSSLMHEIRSSAGNYNINTQGIKKQRIPVPPSVEQNKMLDILSSYTTARAHMEQHLVSSKETKSHIMRQLFFGLA